MIFTTHTITLNNQPTKYYKLAYNNVDTIGNNPNFDPEFTPKALFIGDVGLDIGCYLPLLKKMTESYEVFCLPLQNPLENLVDSESESDSYHDIKPLSIEDDAHQVIEFIKHIHPHPYPMFAFGHGIGASVLAVACAKRVDLFVSLQMITPVSFSQQKIKQLQSFTQAEILQQEPFSNIANKPQHWQSIDKYYQYLRIHADFQLVSDDNLRIIAEQNLKKMNDGFTLKYPPKQELAYLLSYPSITQSLATLVKKKFPYEIRSNADSFYLSDDVVVEIKKYDVYVRNRCLCSDCRGSKRGSVEHRYLPLADKHSKYFTPSYWLGFSMFDTLLKVKNGYVREYAFRTLLVLYYDNDDMQLKYSLRMISDHVKQVSVLAQKQMNEFMETTKPVELFYPNTKTFMQLRYRPRVGAEYYLDWLKKLYFDENYEQTCRFIQSGRLWYCSIPKIQKRAVFQLLIETGKLSKIEIFEFAFDCNASSLYDGLWEDWHSYPLDRQYHLLSNLIYKNSKYYGKNHGNSGFMILFLMDFIQSAPRNLSFELVKRYLPFATGLHVDKLFKQEQLGLTVIEYLNIILECDDFLPSQRIHIAKVQAYNLVVRRKNYEYLAMVKQFFPDWEDIVKNIGYHSGKPIAIDDGLLD